MDALFDRFFDGYDEWYGTDTGKFIDDLETNCAFSLLAPQSGQKILDVCCGTGNFSLKLAKMGCSVTGIDISERMLEAARQKALAQNLDITFIQADCLSVELPEAAFDSVLSMAGFEFLADPKAAYLHLMKFLKPGGILVIGTIQKGGDWEKLYTSPDFKGSAYEKARFLSFDDVKAFDPAAFSQKDECLFIPPGAEQENYTAENEALLKERRGSPGGFMCVLFVKSM